MDFGKLLHVAKQNSSDSNEARCYSTKFAPPKKETKDKNLSSGIKRFLAQKEEEEREKARQLRESRERLESMRDNKSKNKINKMLKVIKSANKSQISDESNPTKVDSPQPLQPDEDDYGYVSQESSVLYKKLMEKYKTSPEENKSGTLRPTGPVATKRQPTSVSVGKSSSSSSSTSSKAPSKSSQPTPGQRRPDTSIKVGAGNNKNIVNGKAQPAATKNSNSNKPRRPPPPVVNFEALLKLAEKKQFEPVKVEKDSTDSSRKDDRPMSAKEKREHEERMRMVEARKRRLENDNYDYRKDANGTKGNNNNNKRPESSAPLNNPGHASAVKRTGGIRPVTATATSSNNNTDSKRPPQPPKATATSSSNGHSNNRMSVPQNKTTAPAAVPTKTRQFPPPDVQRTRSFPPEDVVRRPANASRPFPPADVRRKPQPGPSYGNARDNYKRQRMQEEEEQGYDDYDEEDEDEYDSEMDDFIDDGPLGQADVSNCIKEIFGYDKSRYRDEDFDDREMESSFAQQMREESYSKKVGRMEDAADMRQEALDKARKAALKRAAR